MMASKRILATTIVLACCVCAAYGAKVRLKQYQAPKDSTSHSLDKIYLSGMIDGLLSVDALLALEHKQRFFCLPPKRDLTVEQAENIIMRTARKVPDTSDFPISILLIGGLIDAFPCIENEK